MNIRLPKTLKELINTLHSNKYEAYIVGGCVRDILLGYEPKDYDICTNATPLQIKEVLNVNNYKYITVGEKYGTINVICTDQVYEVTTYRSESNYEDNRHPKEVQFEVDIEKDLSRRDFTINAMAYDIKNNKLIDIYNGQKDLLSKTIRCVGNAEERIKEDALRILRAIRFSYRYNMHIGEDTNKAIFNNIELLNNISKERVTSELSKILSYINTGNYKDFAVDKTTELVITSIIPELKACVGFEQNNKHHRHNVYEHTISVVSLCESNEFGIRLAALLHDIAKPITYVEDKLHQGHFYNHQQVGYDIAINICKEHLRLTKEQYDTVINLVKYHDNTIASTKASVKRALNKYGEERLNKLLILKKADRADHIGINAWKHNTDISKVKEIMQNIKEENQCFKVNNMDINGNDIIKLLDMKPGKQIGIILNTLLEEVIKESIVNEYDVLLNRAREIKESFNVENK